MLLRQDIRQKIYCRRRAWRLTWRSTVKLTTMTNLENCRMDMLQASSMHYQPIWAPNYSKRDENYHCVMNFLNGVVITYHVLWHAVIRLAKRQMPLYNHRLFYIHGLGNTLKQWKWRFKKTTMKVNASSSLECILCLCLSNGVAQSCVAVELCNIF